MSNDESDLRHAIELFGEAVPDDLPGAFRVGLGAALAYGVFGAVQDLVGIPREVLHQVRLNIAARGDRHRQLAQAEFETHELSAVDGRARLADRARMIRAQVNREELAIRVVELLSADVRYSETELGSSASPSEHWLGHFWGQASSVGDDELRDTFARLLLSQVARPQSVSISTLNTVADIDSAIAQRFHRLVACTIRPPDGSLPFVIHPHPFEFLDYGNTRVIGLALDDLIRLDAAGLVNSWRTSLINYAEDNEPELVHVGDRQYWLDRSGRQLHLIYLSQAGAELASVIEVAVNSEYVSSVAALTAVD